MPLVLLSGTSDTFGMSTILEWWRLVPRSRAVAGAIPPAIPAHLATVGFPRGKGEGAWNEADEIQ